MDIYIVEGPAGSGKSTIIQQKQREVPHALTIGTVKQLTMTRDFRGAIGLIDITVRDMQRTAYYMTAGAEEVIIDRYVLSSLVYDAIRKEAAFPNKAHFHHIMMGWVSIIQGLNNVLMARGRGAWSTITLNWMINLPDPQTIYIRRQTGRKNYPFQITEEYDHYGLVKQRMADFIEEYDNTRFVKFAMQDITEGDWQWQGT